MVLANANALRAATASTAVAADELTIWENYNAALHGRSTVPRGSRGVNAMPVCGCTSPAILVDREPPHAPAWPVTRCACCTAPSPRTTLRAAVARPLLCSR
jgi:hypothetical protein